MNVKNKIKTSKIPQQLKDRPHWLAWRYDTDEDGSKTKVPRNALGGDGSSTDPATWCDFETAVKNAEAKAGLDGIGIVVRDDLIGVDIDKCFDAHGDISDEAWEVIEKFNSYWEVSPSGKGIRIFCRGIMPDNSRKKVGRFEMYSFKSPRFLTVTGNAYETKEVIQNQTAIDWFINKHLGLKSVAKVGCVASMAPADLQRIINKASTAANGDKFKKLFAGDITDYKGHSEADAALCSLLAFWTGNDREKIDAIFRLSGLYRQKWERADYRESTIAGVHCAEPFDWSSQLSDETVAEFESWPMPKATEANKAKAKLLPLVDHEQCEGGDESKKKKPAQAEVLIAIARQSMELWKSTDEVPYATHEKRNLAIRSPVFRSLLGGLYFDRTGKASNRTAQDQAIATLAELANRGETHKVFNRVARVRNTIYHDLGGEAGRTIEIDASGWRLIDNPPVKFKRDKNLGELPVAVDGGSIESLKALAACSDEHFPLILGWLLDSLKGRGPYLVGIVGGEQGSAKSTLCKLLRLLVDPLKKGNLNSLPKEEKDLGTDGLAEHCLIYDNVSFIPDWMSDCFCRVSTGGGIKCRQLYTDAEQMIYDILNPIMLNGIPDFATRGDLLDRSVVIHQPRIETRLLETEIDERFLTARPQILGAIYSLISYGLGSTTKHCDLPRMADSANWIANCMGNDSFIVAYRQNKIDANEIALEESPIWWAIQEIVKSNGLQIDMKPSELYEALVKEYSDRQAPLPERFPKNAKKLSDRIRQESPMYRSQGYKVEQGRSHGRIFIKIWVV